MKNTALYKAPVEHISDLLHAYQYYQHNGNVPENLRNIYEFTGHLHFTNRRSTELQFQMNEIANHLHNQLCRSLLGNSYRKLQKQRFQPMIICFFDQEGSREGVSTDKCEFPHIHGLCVIHPHTDDDFYKLTEPSSGNRFRLKQAISGFRDITFKPTENDTNGIMRFTDYCLKSDKIKSHSGNNIFTYGVYPKNNKWTVYLNEISEKDLRKHNYH